MRNDDAIDVKEDVEESSAVEIDDKVKKKKKPLPPSIKIQRHEKTEKLEIDATFFLREPKIAFPEHLFVVPKTPIFDLFLEFFACSNKKDKGDFVSVERNFTCSTPSMHYTLDDKKHQPYLYKIDFIKDNGFYFKLGIDLESYNQFNRDCFFVFVNIFHKLYLRFIDKKDENRVLLLNDPIMSFTAEELGVTDKELNLLCNLKYTFDCSHLNAAFDEKFIPLVNCPCFAKEEGCFIIKPWFLFIMFWTANLGYKLINRGFLSCDKRDVGCILCAFELCFNANFKNKHYSKSNFFKDDCISKFSTKLPNTIQYLSYLKESSPSKFCALTLRKKLLSYFKKLQDKGYFDFYISSRNSNSDTGNNMIPVTDIDSGELQGNKMTARINFNLTDTKFNYNIYWISKNPKYYIKQKSTLF